MRVIVVNSDEDAAPELRSHLLGIEGVKIVAEIEEPALLRQALDQFPAEVLLVHLDPNPKGMMDVIAPIVAPRKDDLVAIAMTEDRDAGLVVQAMRAGMREFLWKPFPPEQLSELLMRLGKEMPASTRRLGRLIPIIGACGGVGTTTLATNLAVELAQLDSWDGTEGAKPRVAVVDLDLRFGQVATYLDAQATHTIAELCESPEQIEAQMVERVMVKHPTGVHVLAHPHDLESASRISAGQCAGALAALQEHYDFVVVDGPVRFDPSARYIFDMTDICLVVLQLIVPAARNADRLLSELRRSGYNLDRIRLVCNRFGREAGYLEPNDVEATLGRKLHWTLPDDWKTSSTAVNVGASLFELSPKARLRLAYRDMAQALASPHDEAAPREEAGGKGLLSIFGTRKPVNA